MRLRGAVFLALLLLAGALSATVGSYTGVATNNESGAAIANASVSVYVFDPAILATLYTDATGVTTTGNPVTANGSGNFTFFAVPGVYYLRAPGMWRAVTITTPTAMLNADSLSTAQLPALTGCVTTAGATLTTACGASQTWTTPTLIKPTVGVAGNAASSHNITAGTSPTVACTGTGSSPPAPTLAGTDAAFVITMSTGTGSPGSSGTCTVTFNSAYVTNMPVMVCGLTSGASLWGNSASVKVTTESLTAPVLTWNNVISGTLTALTISTNYKLSCIAVQK